MKFLVHGLRSLIVGVVAAAAATAATVSQAAWPERAIQIIVPFGAGGAPDIFMRLIAAELSPRLGQPVVIENRPGAGGNIGTQLVAMAPPDGYMLAYGNNGTLATNQFLFKNMPYDPARLTSILALFSTPNLLVVPANSPVRNVADLIAEAKRNPARFNFASMGLGTTAHLGGELFKSLAGVAGQHIPYQSSPAALQDVASGEVQFMFVNVAAALPMVESGKVKAIAITTRERWPLYPNVPTMAEGGLQGYVMESWGGLVAPPGTPDAIVKRLTKELNEILKDPAVKARMDKLLFTGLGGRFAELHSDAGIRAGQMA